jgi:hypothetical protein
MRHSESRLTVLTTFRCCATFATRISTREAFTSQSARQKRPSVKHGPYEVSSINGSANVRQAAARASTLQSVVQAL